jgi:hypothetical protein
MRTSPPFLIAPRQIPAADAPLGMDPLSSHPGAKVKDVLAPLAWSQTKGARRTTVVPDVRPASRMKAAARSVDDLPERILPADLAVDELEQVAAAHLNGFACSPPAPKRPFGDGAVTTQPVVVVAVVDVRNAVEPGLDPFSNLLLADQSLSRTQSSAKKDMIASTSWSLNASRKA